MTTSETLEKLAHQWRVTKATEAAYRAERLGLEIQIVAITSAKSSSIYGPFKIITRPNFSFTVDWDVWDDTIATKLPADLNPIKSKREVDEVKLRHLKTAYPDLYLLASEALTIKPLKPTVEITIKAPE